MPAIPFRGFLFNNNGLLLATMKEEVFSKNMTN